MKNLIKQIIKESIGKENQIEKIKDITLPSTIEGRFLNKQQAQDLQKEIDANYTDNLTQHFKKEKDDIRMHIFNYNNPIAEKNLNGINLRITTGLIRNKRITYLLYANGKIIGEFFSVNDIKKLIKYIEDRLIKNITTIQETVTKTKVICDNCGWSWNIKDGGNDPYTCHKCGHDNNPKNNLNEENILNENLNHYKPDVSPENLEDELYDAQGEKQQFLGPDDENEDLFGDYKNPEIMLISDIANKNLIDGIKKMIDKQGIRGRKIVDGFKKSMLANKPILPVVVWRQGKSDYYNEYSLISGRHRLLASLELGFTHIPVIKMYWRDKDILNEKCWKGYTQKGMKTMFGKQYPNCVKKLKEQETKSEDYSKWKRNNVTLRGIKELGKTNEVYGSFGKGLYTVPSSNKSMARQYGDVYFVVNAKPKNPKVVQNLNDAEILRQRLADKYCKENNVDYSLSFFENNTSMENEMIKLGYDGLIIKGREMVNYKPNNIKYFRTENELQNYYEEVKKNLNEEDYRGEHTAPSKDQGYASMDNLYNAYGDDIYTPNATRYYGEGYPYDNLAIAIMQSARNRPNKQIKVYRAIPDFNYELKEKIKELLKINQFYDKFNFFPIKNYIIYNLQDKYPIEKYSYNEQTRLVLSDIFKQINELKSQLNNNKITINNGDWVTTTLQYAKSHGKSHLNNKYKVISKVVPASSLYTDGNSIHEFGYNP